MTGLVQVSEQEAKRLEFLFTESLAVHEMCRRLGFKADWIYIHDEPKAVLPEMDAKGKFGTITESTKIGRMWCVVLRVPREALERNPGTEWLVFRFDIGQPPESVSEADMYRLWKLRGEEWNQAGDAKAKRSYERSTTSRGAPQYVLALTAKGLLPLRKGAGNEPTPDRPRAVKRGYRG